jgi:hypothetical protein
MLGPDDINKTVNYTFKALQALPPHLIGRLSFVGYPERHGINVLDLLFPKNPKYGKLDTPASYTSQAGSACNGGA